MAAAADGLPAGFRFQPTDKELVIHYLEPKVCGQRIDADIIPVVDNLYKREPWELPEMSFNTTAEQPECYLFGPRDRKYPSGNRTRTKRATPRGHWKSTGNDRCVLHNGRWRGMKKTLVYYEGRAPNGVRTHWKMHEYYCLGNDSMGGIQFSSYVLCRVFERKPTSSQVQVGVPLASALSLLEVITDGDISNDNVNFNIKGWLCIDDQLITFDDVPSNDVTEGFFGAAVVADADTGNVNTNFNIEGRLCTDDQLITFDDDYSCMGYFPFSGAAAVADGYTDEADNVVDWPLADEELNIFEDDYSWMADYFPSNDGGCSGAAPDV